MPAVNRGEVWMVDFGLAAKVRPALLLTGVKQQNWRPAESLPFKQSGACLLLALRINSAP